MTKKERAKILTLPRSERFALMLDLWDTLEDQTDEFGISEQDEKELCRRADDIEKHPERFISGKAADDWMRDLKRRVRTARRKAS